MGEPLYSAGDFNMILKKCGIYKITNPKKKIYIGQSVNIDARLKTYKKLHCKAQPLIYKSLLKYGVENHKFELIHECKPEGLNDLEIYYINLYQTFNSNFGLNLQSGGESIFKMSEETKAKIAAANTGRVFSPETRAKIAKANLGRKMSKEAKLNMSKAAKKKFESPEARFVAGSSTRGKKLSEERCRQISRVLTGRIASTETRKKLSAWQLGKKLTKEHKDKLRLAKLGKKLPESHKNKISESMKKYRECQRNQKKY